MDDEFDRMVDFERYLHDRFGEHRPSSWPQGKLIAHLHFNRIKSVRPDRVMEILGVSRAGLVDLIMSGKLSRPRIIGKGEVEWRKSEIETEVLT